MVRGQHVNPGSEALRAGTAENIRPWAAVGFGVFGSGERRLEASSYLTDGYGRRRLIEARDAGWSRFESVADIWQPSRLKGVVVRPGAGVPYLSAGQIFEGEPTVRKWLAASRIPAASTRFVEAGWILVSRSGDVGRVTAVYPQLQGVVVTDDMLRVEPHFSEDFGWIYAYLRTKSFKAIARTSQYGHMIKHLEPEQVAAMPIIDPGPDVKAEAARLVAEMLWKRRESFRLRKESEAQYQSLIAPDGLPADPAIVSSVPASELIGARRRLDATFATPQVRRIQAAIGSSNARAINRLDDVTASVKLGSRFKRFFGEKGTPYRSASELFDLNAPVTKRIFSAQVENAEAYELRRGWIVMACSGQVYGLNGRAMILGSRHDGVFGSHDLIRIVPNEEVVPTGYLLTALTHPALGRPMVIRNAYGTSIPHLDPVDVRNVLIPRFGSEDERSIGDLAVRSAELRDEADELEDRAIALAEGVVEAFIATGSPTGTE